VTAIRIEVDGQAFEVVAHADRAGQYHFTWLSGPNPDYGFTSASSDGSSMSTGDLEDAIRNFISQVDPETGYIE
jgi:hypothetical protein